MPEEVLDLVIVGAGPSGLATAIAAHQAGLAYEVVEKGVLVNSIFHFPRHMTFFTTADLLEIGGLPFVSPYEKPTQMEGLKYYRRVTETYGLRVWLGEEVVGITKSRLRVTRKESGRIWMKTLFDWRGKQFLLRVLTPSTCRVLPRDLPRRLQPALKTYGGSRSAARELAFRPT